MYPQKPDADRSPMSNSDAPYASSCGNEGSRLFRRKKQYGNVYSRVKGNVLATEIEGERNGSVGDRGFVVSLGARFG